MAINISLFNGMTSAGQEDLQRIETDYIAQAGVVNLPTDFLVSQNGVTKSVLVSSGSASVLNSAYSLNSTTQPKYWPVVNDATITSTTFADNISGNPRIDIVCLRVNTAAIPDAVGSNVASIVVIQGIAGASPAVPATPANHLLLAQVAIANAYTSISNANITDRRSLAFLKTNANIDGLFKNGVINSNFDVWQRGTSITNSSAVSSYTADRWIGFTGVVGTGYTTFSRQDGTGVVGSQYCMRVQRNSGQTGLFNLFLAYGLESNDAIKYRGNRITVSFWARAGANYSAASSNLDFEFITGTGIDQNIISGFTGQTLVAQSNTLSATWTKYTFTTASPIPNTVNQIGFRFKATPVGTAGANDFFEVAQVQLNAGDVALSYSPPLFSNEIVSCYRYFRFLGTTLIGIWNGGTTCRIYYSFATPMRAFPVITLTTQNVDIEKTLQYNRSTTNATATFAGAPQGMHMTLSGTFSGVATAYNDPAQLNTDCISISAEL